LSCTFLNMLPQHSIVLVKTVLVFIASGKVELHLKFIFFIQKLPMKDEISAELNVRSGHIWGYLTFPHNYSSYLIERAIEGNFATNETIDGSRILVKLDMSSNSLSYRSLHCI